ncbi:MAG: hypothetical protein Q8P57_03390 [Candidatus Pacearchaeota archaeon]|nr:hypothetical protein [Candidatus Pacearchaeota archaeon]
MAKRIGFAGMFNAGDSSETGRYGRILEGFVNPRDDPYFLFRDKFVEVDVQGTGQEYGCYQGIDHDGNVVLSPFITMERRPRDPNVPPERGKKIFFWVDEPPCLIPGTAVSVIKPISGEYLEKIVSESNSGDEVQGNLFDYKVK